MAKVDVNHSRCIYARVYNANTLATTLSSVTLDSGSVLISSDTSVDSIGATFYGPGNGLRLGAFSSRSSSVPSLRSLRFGAADVTMATCRQRRSTSGRPRTAMG